jgi:hypothetical protein
MLVAYLVKYRRSLSPRGELRVARLWQKSLVRRPQDDLQDRSFSRFSLRPRFREFGRPKYRSKFVDVKTCPRFISIVGDFWQERISFVN